MGTHWHPIARKCMDFCTNFYNFIVTIPPVRDATPSAARATDPHAPNNYWSRSLKWKIQEFFSTDSTSVREGAPLQTPPSVSSPNVTTVVIPQWRHQNFGLGGTRSLIWGTEGKERGREGGKEERTGCKEGRGGVMGRRGISLTPLKPKCRPCDCNILY